MSTSHPAELQLLDYVEGSLTGEELRGLRRHVSTCSACQETLRELSHAVDALERLPTVGIPHDGMRHTVTRNRRRLWMRAVPIFAIVLAAGAIVQELRPAATGSNGTRAATSAATARRPAESTSWVVAHIPATGSEIRGVTTALSAFNAFIEPAEGSLVALVPYGDLAEARQSLQHARGTRAVTVLLIGVEGLNPRLQQETIRPVTPASPQG